MRYEFERDGTVVASVLWEGPGQVRSRRPTPRRARSSTGTCRRRSCTWAAGSTSDEAQVADVLQMRRRDWTPWEFERACREPGPPPAGDASAAWRPVRSMSWPAGEVVAG